jgi:hypothetical protein
LANKLRARHLEEYDLQGGPVAFADSSGIAERLRTARMQLEKKLAVSLRADHGERTARMLLQRLNQEGDTERPSALPLSPDLPWFRQTWEAHVKRFHHGLAPEVLVGGLRKYCMPRAANRMIEPARDPGEAWRILESHFCRQMRIIDELISELL